MRKLHSIAETLASTKAITDGCGLLVTGRTQQHVSKTKEIHQQIAGKNDGQCTVLFTRAFQNNFVLALVHLRILNISQRHCT